MSPQALRRAVVMVSPVSADWGRTSRGSRDTRGLSRLISEVASSSGEVLWSRVQQEQGRADGLQGEVAIRGRIWLCRGFYTVCNGSEEYRE